MMTNKMHTCVSSQNRLNKKVVKIYRNIDLACLLDERQVEELFFLV